MSKAGCCCICDPVLLPSPSQASRPQLQADVTLSLSNPVEMLLGWCLCFSSRTEKRGSLPISQVPEYQQRDRERCPLDTHTRTAPAAWCGAFRSAPDRSPSPRAQRHLRTGESRTRRPGRAGVSRSPTPRAGPARPGQIRKFPRWVRPPPPVPTQAGHVQHAGDAAVAHVHLGLVLLPALLHDLLQGLGHGLGGAETDTVSRAAGETRRGDTHLPQPGQRRDGPGPERPRAENPPSPAPPGEPVPSRPARRARPCQRSTARDAGRTPAPGVRTDRQTRSDPARPCPARGHSPRGAAAGHGGKRRDTAGGSHGGSAGGPRRIPSAPPPSSPRAGAAQPRPCWPAGAPAALRGSDGPGLPAFGRAAGDKTRYRQNNPHQKTPRCV